MDNNLRALQPTSTTNNIKETVEAKGYSFCKEPYYSTDIPTTFACKYGIISDHNTQLILQNRINEERLPLKIAKSKIPGAGLGVFTTQDILPKTLVCSYIGEIGTHESGEYTDSTYEIGWIDKLCIIINPKRNSNVGRFINSSNTTRTNNCRATIGLLRYISPHLDTTHNLKRATKPGPVRNWS